MLLTIYNLPGHARYTDVKSLLQEKCGLTDFILDNLVSHMKGKRVTVGLADEEDAAILVRKINGLYLNGQQLYVEDSRKKKESDQPYRASASIDLDSQYQALAVNPQHNVMGDGMAAVVNNPMMMNYNMMPVYMPMMPMEQNAPYMGYGGSHIESSMDPRSMSTVHNERGPVGFQGEGVAPGNRPREQGHDTIRHRDRNRNPTPERPVDYNRPSRWNEQPAPIEAQVRRERSPPDHRWAPRETNQAQRLPFGIRNSERPGRRNQDLYSPRPSEPRGEPQNMPWGPEPNPPRPEPDQDWTAAPNQNWQPEPNRVWDKPNRRREEPNPQWEGESRRHERDYPPKERFQQNDRHIDEGHPLGRYQNEHDLPRREHGFQDVRERESRHPATDWNKNNGNDRWDKNRGSNNSGKETTYKRGPSPSSTRHNNAAPKPSFSNTYLANERRDDRRPNPPKRNHPEREGGPANWSQIANNYPPSKKPRDNLDMRGIEGPRQKIFAPKENTNIRPGIRAPFRPDAAAPRFTNPATLPIRPAKPQSVKSMINKDQTCRGQTTAMLAKQAMAGSTIGNTELTSRILKKLKECIKGRIDVMLGEELSSNVDDVIARYRLKYPKKEDRPLYQLIRDKCMYHEKTQVAARGAKSDAVIKPYETESKEEAKKDEATGEKKDVKEERVSQKTNKRPQTDKQIVKENKQQQKLEFNTEDYFKLDPATDNILDEELEKLTDIFASECDNPIDGIDKTICKTIQKHCAADFKRVARIHVKKRILGIHTGLMIRIFSSGKLPKKSVMKEYLKGIRIERLSVVKNKKGTMFVANVGNFEQYDYLCRKEHDVIDGVPVTFRSMHLIGPALKISRAQIKKRRKQMIQSQVDSTSPDEELIEDNLFTEDAEDFKDATEYFKDDTECFKDDTEYFKDDTEYFKADTEYFNEETEDFPENSQDYKGEFSDDINISSIKDEDLVDF